MKERTLRQRLAAHLAGRLVVANETGEYYDLFW